MKFLQQQAFQILLETKVNSKLHELPCNFVKKPNQVYSVYEKPAGECYLSMLTPEVSSLGLFFCGVPMRKINVFVLRSRNGASLVRINILGHLN